MGLHIILLIAPRSILPSEEACQVATGTLQPSGRGYKCGNSPIWNNDGETIYLQAASGGGWLQIEAARVR